MKFLYYSLCLLVTIPLYSQTVPQYKYPGVYVQEIPSGVHIVPAETRITAFIGCTEKNINTGKQTTLITSLMDFERQFGRAAIPKFKLSGLNNLTQMKLQAVSNSKYFLYDAIRLFFQNGGNRCYVVSVGDYKSRVQKTALLKGLNTLKLMEEINQIAIPDAMSLNRYERAEVQQKMLVYAKKQNCFAILDVFDEAGKSSSISNFRADIQNGNLKYGAAYYPWLTILPHRNINPADCIIGWNRLDVKLKKKLQSKLKLALAKQQETLPPSGAIAGIYAQMDNKRGVWKAPANVSIRGITGLTKEINSKEQASMNVSVEDGKSINALRQFTGKGYLVWGARTLAGNDNEWRYVPVRRTVLMIENSINPYLQSMVFESNDANTWRAVKGAISQFLTNLWREGALQGATTEEAFAVQVGLGKTMTAQDILEGKMIVSVMIAPVRPAEFIILNFEIKMRTN